VETEGAAVFLLRASRCFRARSRAIARAERSSLAVGVLLEGSPLVLAPHGFSAPASWFAHLAVFATEAPVRDTDSGDLPQACAPLQSFARKPTHHHDGAELSRGFSPPQRHPIVESHHSRGLPIPGHVASSRLPCAPTHFSLDDLPGVLSTRRAHGASPFRASPGRDCQHLSMLTAPLAIRQAGIWCAFQRGSRCAELSLKRGARFRGHPSAGWGRCDRVFADEAAPWLSWGFTSLGLSPSVLRPLTVGPR
jgi:hypothetical protein